MNVGMREIDLSEHRLVKLKHTAPWPCQLCGGIVVAIVAVDRVVVPVVDQIQIELIQNFLANEIRAQTSDQHTIGSLVFSTKSFIRLSKYR
jgi:hypothetical protein